MNLKWEYWEIKWWWQKIYMMPLFSPKMLDFYHETVTVNALNESDN